MQELIIKDVMSSDVLCVSPRKQARAVAALMREHGFSCVVIAEGRTPEGVVTERDLVRMLGKNRAAVADVASEPVTAPAQATGDAA